MRSMMLWAAGLLVVGCGEATQPPEAVFPVTGVITFQGAPVVGADVTFHNADKKRSAFGRTNDKGEYKLTTFSANDGAVEGRAVLTIVKHEEPTAPTAVADTESADYMPPEMMPPEKPKKVKPILPTRYSSTTTSGLMANVTKEGPNELNFDLSL